ncbi:unnamed protein product [Parascedosporium putredinis]|uniref:Uncharacterized protein n=1 Tax=Parascedosporium putredinis TaxID=1442378 RepID=A0A9P1MA33_9PEZI|nr:unnamed protein product [Parascedosporium putredinis]CAI7991964.1 unnamed protein product [Parascedosporium putredinis]
MATEATLEKHAYVPISNSESTPNTAVYGQDDLEKGPQDVERSSDQIGDRHAGVDDPTPSTDSSLSGGSDTEAYKADPSKSPNLDKGHAASSSAAKRPPTFKTVSVNKTFLASKTGLGPSAPKAGDKFISISGITNTSASSGLTSIRPRLVAKTGSGNRDSSPRFAANGGKQSTAPDPASVWNKNKQDIKGQANWADIDDDDDDWAPETITWTDGTRITLPPPDEIPNSTEPPQLPALPTSKETPSIAPIKSSPPLRSTSPSKSGGLASGKSLILKAGSTEKVTLVTKPVVPPQPAKSPWAPLPPIQKASPVATDATRTHVSPRPPFREASLHKPLQHPPGREIAVDDFTRSSWRDAPIATGRELYNSQSGRYEPVQDRRGSFRADTYGRPALLQRPYPHHDSTEPSPTFQTSRAVQDLPFSRRRASSNVSGGSGLLQKSGKGFEQSTMQSDVLSTRRESFTTSTDSHASPRNFSPSGQSSGRYPPTMAWPPKASPSSTYASPHSAHVGPEKPPSLAAAGLDAPLNSEEEAVEFQKRLMRERREEAIRRRLEEEAREEAAKAERIRLKLEAMGPPPERKSIKREQAKKDHVDIQTMSTRLRETGPNRDVPPLHEKDTQGKLVRQAGSNQSDPWNASTTVSANRLVSWPSSSQQSSRNVWGSPDNDRGLGNGTFNPDLGRVLESRTTQPPQSQPDEPAPIGHLSGRMLNRQHSQPSSQSFSTSRPERYPATEQRPFGEKQNQWVQSVLQEDDTLPDNHSKEPDSLDRRVPNQALTLNESRSAIKQTWHPDPDPSRSEHNSRVVTSASWARGLDEGNNYNNSEPSETPPATTRGATQLWPPKPPSVTTGMAGKNIRINRAPASPRSPAVDSATRMVFDHSIQRNPAMVSLPIPIASKSSNLETITSKPMAEECFEEQEMGSLPSIRIPHKAPDAAWQPATSSNKALPRTLMVVATTTKLFDPVDINSCSIRISFPLTEPRTVALSAASSRGSSRASGHTRITGRNRGSAPTHRGSSNVKGPPIPLK